ncbi:alpha/beta fold hydrolase [Palleronia sp. KMU-117]|uniref:alpha/beta fold hydrolase n=1 Tax=Palleronia sp. KMU-117 TaxID=3434108 RepID=UPI003D730E83
MVEPLLLVPGMMCDARLYAAQIAALSRERAVQVAALTGADTVEAMADQIIFHAPPKFALAGLSMGGIVAMEIMRRVPMRVTRLALMDTTPLSETPVQAAAREPQIARAKAGRLAEVMAEDMKPAYLAPGPGRARVLKSVMQMALDLGPGVYVRQSRALQRRPDQQRTLRGVKVPTLILCGRHDGLCPVRRHDLMAGLVPGATLEILEDAGHLPTLEEPDATTEALRRWLSGTLLLK